MNTKQQAVFLGGIPITTSEHEIREHFLKYGPIKEVTMKTDPKTGRNKPYAFQQFYDKTSTLLAISEEQKIGGRNIDCELSCFDDTISKNDRYNKLRNTKQFVNHIKQEVTQSEFRKYFSQFGEIKQSYIVECPKTKKSKCFGFLRYYNLRDADKVLRHEHYLRGKLLIINRFEPQIEKNAKKEAELASKHVESKDRKHFDKKEFDYVKKDELSPSKENFDSDDQKSDFKQKEMIAKYMKDSLTEQSLGEVNNAFEQSKKEGEPKTEKKKLRQSREFLSNFENKTTNYESNSLYEYDSPQVSGELNLNDQNNFSNYTEGKKQRKNKKIDKNSLLVNYSMQNENNNNSNLNSTDDRQNMKNLPVQNMNLPLFNFVGMNNCGCNHNNLSNSFINQSKNQDQNSISTIDPLNYKLAQIQMLYLNNKANMQIKNKQNLHGSDGKNVFTNNDCYNNSLNNIDLRTMNQMLNQENDQNMAKLNDFLLKKSILESVDINNMSCQGEQQNNFNNLESIRKKLAYKTFEDNKKNNFNMWKGGYLPPTNRIQLSNLELQKERLEKSNDIGLFKEKLLENYQKNNFENLSWNGNVRQDVIQNPNNFFSGPVLNQIPQRSSDISLKIDPFSSLDDDIYQQKEKTFYEYINNNRKQSGSMYGDFSKHNHGANNNKEGAFSDQMSSNTTSNTKNFGGYNKVSPNNFQKPEGFTMFDESRTVNQNNNSNLFFNNRQNNDPQLTKKDNSKSNNELFYDKLMEKDFYTSDLDKMQHTKHQGNNYNIETKNGTNEFGTNKKNYEQDNKQFNNVPSETELFPGNSFSDLMMDYKHFLNNEKE